MNEKVLRDAGVGRPPLADEPHPARLAAPLPRWLSVSLASLVLAGLALMLYPSASSWLFALRERGIVAAHTEEVAKLDPSEVAAELASAEAYNRRTTHGLIVDPFGTADQQGALDEDAQGYLAELDLTDDGVMATLRIAELDLELPVFHGATDQVLAEGVGHIYGSSLPVGGPSSHAVLTAHSGIPEAELFTRLDRLGRGDLVSVSTLGRELSYRVTGTEVVEPTDIQNLVVVPGEDLLTLVTCTPIGVNSHRLLVHAERTASPADADADAAGSPMPFPWWALGLGAGTVGWVVVVTRAARSGPSRNPAG
ncbi:class C sortase [Leucobacter luti]|uniref:class C sortase n=1 Tax=Leucobacter luti TaxID=340320 RepID=UPI003D03DC5B